MLEEIIYDNAQKFKEILQEGSAHQELRNKLLASIASFNVHKLFEETAKAYDSMTYDGDQLVYKSKYYDRVDNFDYKRERAGGGSKWGNAVELRIGEGGVVKGRAMSKGIIHPDHMETPEGRGFVQLPRGEDRFEEVFTKEHTPEDVRSLVEHHEAAYVEVGKRWQLVDYEKEEVVDTVLEREWDA